jgi:hypothetical protein
VLAVHGHELAAYPLQLWQVHGCSRQLDGLFHVYHLDLTTTFACVVFLVCHDLGEDVGGRLVELVEVVLLGGGFLSMSVIVLGRD